jgi:hypothetical protein
MRLPSMRDSPNASELWTSGVKMVYPQKVASQEMFFCESGQVGFPDAVPSRHAATKEAPGMAGIIEVDSRGGPAAQFIEKAIYTLREEYAAAGVKIRTLRLESVPPFPQIVIGVITPVPVALIAKLVDTVLNARKAAEKHFRSAKINVFITHQEGARRFSLPAEKEECEQYFESLSAD